ncbi:MAG: hypothetical protein EA384_09205 [Spirochaetaceae bacterium]|nr:MAG: hypothetical protein EA384_09205 [Spirochaetaceae bacterium]
MLQAKAAAWCALLLLLPLTVPAQQNNETGTVAEIPLSLTQRTMAQDIATADFEELVVWLSRIGLSTRGSRSELQDRLFDHYGVSRPADPEREATREITIESALESEYFLLEQIDQRYIRLRGGVHVRMEDFETGVTHRISAEEIVFNQTENSLTARGEIEYLISRPGQGDERFSGQGITVFLNTWEGVFLEGRSTRPRIIEDEEIEFSYSGRYITRSADDIIVMEDGTITSSPVDPPNYHIRARRIWVLGPGEWGLQNAVLYVGRVPVFYFPFFFRHGDRLFFNPVAGYRNRQGAFIQTTSYLIGSKQARETSVSFLQLADEGEGETRRVREGLFMRPATADDPPPRFDDQDWNLRLLADIYTRMGAYVGLEGELPQLWFFDRFDGALGIGVSRPVRNHPPGTLGYTNYFIDQDGNSIRYWDSTRFAGATVPFRYKTDIGFTTRVERLNLRGDFELYSDRYVDLDFGDRSEDMDWLALVGEGPDFEPETVSEKRSLLWRLSGSYSAPVNPLSPWIQSLSVQNFVTSLSWNSKATAFDALPDYADQADRSPQDHFFYPARLTAPDIGVRMTGSVLDSRRPRARAAAPDDEPQFDILAPWESESEESLEETGAPDEGYRRLPAREADLTGLRREEPANYRVSYTLTPRLTVINEYDQSEWREPDDIDFAFAYSSLTSNNSARISYQGDIYDRLFVISGSIDSSYRYRSIYNAERLDDAQLRNLETQAFRYGSARVANNLRLSTFPFVRDRYFERTNVSYDLNTTLYDRAFVGRDPDDDSPIYADRFFRWDDEFVRAHALNMNLLVNYWRATQSLRVRADLPPLDDRYNGRLDLITGPLTSTVEAEARRIEDEWRYSPLTVTETLRFREQLSLRQRFVYDIEEDEVDSLSTSLRVWPLTATLNFRNTPGFRFVGPELGTAPWEPRGEDKAALRATDSDLRLDVRYESDPLWRNRVRWGARFDSLLRMNFLRFTESFLDLRLGFNLRVHQFLDLSFSSVSRNALVYQYVPSLAERVGVPQRSFLEDITNSFAFGDQERRQDSPFNIQSISIAAVHHLDDWDLTLRYTGNPEVVQDSDGRPQYRWIPLVEISLVWRPFPEIRSEVRWDDDELFY